MAKKYLGSNSTNKLMKLIIGALPSKEINEVETQQIWDSLTPGDDPENVEGDVLNEGEDETEQVDPENSGEV